MTKEKYTPESLEDALELIDDLKADNAKLRRQKSALKEQLSEYGDDTETLSTLKEKLKAAEAKVAEAEELKTKYEELNAKFEEVNGKVTKVEKLEKLTPIFNKLNITDKKAVELALEKLGDATEDTYEEAAKKVVEDYPFLASKPSKSIPDTGKAKENNTSVPVNVGSKLAEGITAKIEAIN